MQSFAMGAMLSVCVGIKCILHQSCCYRYNAGSFFANWAAVLLSLLTAQSIGLLIGSVITHPKTGQTIATITALTMILVSTTHETVAPRLQPQAVHCRYNAGSFFANWAAVLLSLLTAQSIGLLVGSVITHPKTGQTIATITALTMVLVRTIHHSNPIPLTLTPHLPI